MIADRNTGVERVSTLQGDKIAMSIDTSSEAMAHIMKSMIDLYKDQELACIREYSTNAWDAHVQAGTTNRPIEVELPGPLSPFLTIRDYGVGLSVDDIFEVYSKYGASTKRDSNDVQGMLGYGCKAALSYTPQFTVTSVKDGVRAQIAVSRETNGGGSMQIVDTSSTTEANGTTIMIPVRRDNEFESKARLFYSFWEPGTVLVNSKPPEQLEGLPVGDDMTVIEAPMGVYNRREYGRSYVVMGKVAYPANFGYTNLARGYGLVARVPIGAVNFTPSREGLMEQDQTTMNTLRDITAKFQQLAPAAIQKQIDKAPTAAEALDTLIRFQAMIPGVRQGNYVYKGRNLPASYRLSGVDEAKLSTRRSSALGSCTAVWDWEASQWPSTLWMENHDATKYTATHKRKILQWCDVNGKTDLKNFVSIKGSLPADIKRYVDPTNVIQWQQIKDEKLPPNNSGYSLGGYKTKSITGSFDVWIDGDWKGEFAANSIDAKKPLFYKHGNRHQCTPYMQLMQSLTPGATFVCVPGNRLDKFARDFPAAIEACTALTGAWEKWKKSLSADTLVAMAMEDRGQIAFFKSLDILRVNDPAIKRAIRVAKIDLTNPAKKRKLFNIVARHNQLTLPGFDNPMKAYPLIVAQYGRYSTAVDKITLDHFYLYVNAAYEASKKGS